MRALVTIVTALILVPMLTLSAQISSRLNTADHIRVSTQDMIYTGNLVAQWNDSLQLRIDGNSAPVTVARGDIQRLEVSHGAPAKTGTGAAAGAIIGLVLGGGFGAAIGKSSDACTGSDPSCQVGPAIGVGLLGAAVGAGIGAAIGSGIHGEEQWEAVPIDAAH